jgi:hypothetical protein
MRVRKLTFTMLALLSLPAVAPAGLIEFNLTPGNLTFANPSPGADATLVPIQPPAPAYGFDPATGAPAHVGILDFAPRWLPDSPAWSTALPNGNVHWDVNGYYGLPLTLTDSASGQSATFTFYGQAHMMADYSPATGWTGSATFSSKDWHQARLGGNLYTVWGTDATAPGPAAVDVWVGNGVPPAPQYTPEPGTLALAALGLVPLALRRLRR